MSNDIDFVSRISREMCCDRFIVKMRRQIRASSYFSKNEKIGNDPSAESLRDNYDRIKALSWLDCIRNRNRCLGGFSRLQAGHCHDRVVSRVKLFFDTVDSVVIDFVVVAPATHLCCLHRWPHRLVIRRRSRAQGRRPELCENQLLANVQAHVRRPEVFFAATRSFDTRKSTWL